MIAGNAPEYLEPLATLQENMQIRTKVAGMFDIAVLAEVMVDVALFQWHESYCDVSWVLCVV